MLAIPKSPVLAIWLGLVQLGRQFLAAVSLQSQVKNSLPELRNSSLDLFFKSYVEGLFLGEGVGLGVPRTRITSNLWMKWQPWAMSQASWRRSCMAKGDGWPWVRQKAHQTMQVWGHMNRVFRGAWRAGRRVSSAVATFVPSRHQLQQKWARGSLDAEPHAAQCPDG